MHSSAGQRWGVGCCALQRFAPEARCDRASPCAGAAVCRLCLSHPGMGVRLGLGRGRGPCQSRWSRMLQMSQRLQMAVPVWRCSLSCMCSGVSHKKPMLHISMFHKNHAMPAIPFNRRRHPATCNPMPRRACMAAALAVRRGCLKSAAARVRSCRRPSVALSMSVARPRSQTSGGGGQQCRSRV